MEKKIQENKSLLDSTGELVILQAKDLKRKITDFSKEAREQIKKNIEDTINYIRTSSQEFGPRAQAYAESIIKEYEQGKESEKNVIVFYKRRVNSINEQYDAEIKSLVQTIQEYREKEEECYVKENKYKRRIEKIKATNRYSEDKKLLSNLEKQRKQAIREHNSALVENIERKIWIIKSDSPVTDIDKVKEEIEQEKARKKQYKELIKICNKEIEESHRGRIATLTIAGQHKDAELKEINQGKISRNIVGNVMNKINDVMRFKSVVIEGIREKIEALVNDKTIEIQENAQKRNEKINKLESVDNKQYTPRHLKANTQNLKKEEKNNKKTNNLDYLKVHTPRHFKVENAEQKQYTPKHFKVQGIEREIGER